MNLLVSCIFLCLMLGIVLFFIIGIFFLKKEWEWNRFEKAREIWDLSVDVVNYLEGRKPTISPQELEEEVKKIMSSLQVSSKEEFIRVLVAKGEQ